MKIIYKPSVLSIFIDFLILIISIIIVLQWFPLTTRTPYDKYADGAMVYYLCWVLVSYLFGRYKPLHTLKYKDATLKLIYITLIIFLILWEISVFFFNGYYSVYVLFSYTTIIYFVYSVFYLLYFILLYAVEYEEVETITEQRENAILIPSRPLDDSTTAGSRRSRAWTSKSAAANWLRWSVPTEPARPPSCVPCRASSR